MLGSDNEAFLYFYGNGFLVFFSSDEVHMMPGNFTPVSLLAVLALLHGNKLRVIPGLFEHS